MTDEARNKRMKRNCSAHNKTIETIALQRQILFTTIWSHNVCNCYTLSVQDGQLDPELTFLSRGLGVFGHMNTKTRYCSI
jgi:hypothetical protein